MSMLTSESYLPGAEALLHSLRQTRTLREIVMMVTPDVSERVRSKLLKFCDRVVEVEPISRDHAYRVDARFGRRARLWGERARSGGGYARGEG